MTAFLRLLFLLMIATSIFFSIGTIGILVMDLLGMVGLDIGTLLLMGVTDTFAMSMLIISIWGYSKT